MFAALCGYVLVACASGGDSGNQGGTCGNGVKDGAEACDGKDLGGITCQILGFKGGALSCQATSCQLDPNTCCTDTCVNVGDTQCQGTVLQTCTQGASGCRAWAQTADCALSGGQCDATGGNAACTSTCVDACPVLIGHVDAILDMRRHLTMMEGAVSNELTGMFKNVENNYNPWGIGADKRAAAATGPKA
ncbi:MAG: hypothetical protein DPW22_11950 [Alphaproteobacteria bacterium]|nr:hypothetical protein [Alphaproteobacteria bacterium]